MDYRYKAFISYRHNDRDTAVAKAIQQGLERFHIPASIREKYGTERIGRVFRDQEELEITSDLSKKIMDALDDSEYLVIICSPHYTESRWCLLEAETFIRTHDRDHVLCVLSEGEPPAVFPEILLQDGAEPLACDWRMDFRDANRMELPRLASAMIGCTYDELILRQEKYRRKRLISVLSAAAVLGTAAISYLLWSNAAIAGSYRQSQISESRLLASQSLAADERVDRLAALQSALAALPSEDSSRPVTDDAVYALSRAVYAYTVPYHIREDWRIDLANDIVSWQTSPDGMNITVLDNTGEFHTLRLDSRQHLASFRAGTGQPSEPERDPAGNLITYAGGSVYSVNPVTGKENWHLPLKYRTLGMTAVSPDGAYIAAGDSFAVQVMTAEGKPYLSLPLPEDTGGYITDLCWSDDAQYIAVRLRLAGQGYQFGIFDFSTSEFFLTDTVSTHTDSFCFDRHNRLLVLSHNDENSSWTYGGTAHINQAEYILQAWDRDQLCFAQRFVTAEEPGFPLVRAYGDGAVLVLGSRIHVLDGQGSIIRTLEAGGIISALPETGEYFHTVTADGRRGLIMADTGTGSLQKSFPAGHDRVEMITGKDRQTRYLILKDGNVCVFTYLQDDHLVYLPAGQMRDAPLGGRSNAGQAVISTTEGLLFCDAETRGAHHPAAAGNHVYHILDITGDCVSVLDIDAGSGSLRLQNYDHAGKLVQEWPLSVNDALTADGLLASPLDIADKVFLDAYYSAPGAACVQNRTLYIHDYDNPQKIAMLSLDTGEEKILEVSLPGTFSLTAMNGFDRASALTVSPDGAYLYTVMTDRNSTRKAVLIHLPDGEVLELPGTPDAAGTAVFSGQQLVYAAEDGLYCTEGTELSDVVYYTGEPALSFAVRDGRLFAVYPDGTLQVYSQGERIRTVQLPFGTGAAYSAAAFRWEFTGDRLCLYRDDSLDIISLDSDSSLPVYSVPGAVLDYDPERKELLSYAYDPQKNDLYYYPGLFREYTVSELIDIGNAQLAGYSTAGKEGEQK